MSRKIAVVQREAWRMAPIDMRRVSTLRSFLADHSALLPDFAAVCDQSVHSESKKKIGCVCLDIEPSENLRFVDLI